MFHTAKAKELRALFTRKDWCAKGHGNATFIVWWRIFTFESKFHQKAWYARDRAPRAVQTACASREQVRGESIIPSAQRFCVRVPPAQCQAFTGRELCAKCLEVSTKRALKEAKTAQCSPLLRLSLGCQTLCCWWLRNFGGSHANPCFRSGKRNTLCFWAAGGATVLSRARRWGWGCGAGWARMSAMSSQKSPEVGHRETWDPWLEGRHARCLWICTVGHVDRAVKHDRSEALFLDMHQRRLSTWKWGWRHGAAPHCWQQHLSAPASPSQEQGTAKKTPKDVSCSMLRTAVNCQKVWCLQIDSWTAAQSQTGILLCSVSSWLWELGPNLINFQWQLRTSLPKRPWKLQPLLNSV